MTWFWWLILGMLIGWLVEWAIDWFYWRDRVGGQARRNAQLEAEIETMRGERDQSNLTLRTLRSDAERSEGELQTVRGEYDRSQGLAATLRADNERVQGELATLRNENQRLSRDLAAALQDANGLTSLRGEFDRLRANFASATAERDRMRGEIETARGQLATCGNERESLQRELASVRGTANEREQEAGSLRARLAELMAAGAARAEKLVDSGKAFFAGESRGEETPELGFSPGGAVVSDDVQVDADHANPFTANVSAAIPESQTQATLGGNANMPLQRRDPLIDIDGIGPVYEQKLFSAGVTTFAQLAQMTPDDVRAIIQPEAWQNVDFVAWIAEAGEFATRRGSERNG